MAGTNNILQFDSNQINVLSQSSYATDADRLNGNAYSTGQARSALVNKALLQTSTMSAALAQFIVDNSGANVNDSDSITTIKNNLLTAVEAAAGIGGTSTDPSNTYQVNGAVRHVNYFSGALTGVISIKIAGLVTATASRVDLGLMKIVITQDDRDHSSVTNPASYELLIKGNMDTGMWYNTQAMCPATNSTTSLNIRFTRTTTDAYVEIGDIGLAWNYTTLDIYHVASYVLTGYTPTFTSTLQNSLLGTTATDSIINVIPNSTKNENTIQTAVASASTCTIGTYLAGDTVHITGTTTITNLGVSTTGTIRNVIFDGILILTYNATSLNLPTSANITTAVGDTATFVCTNGASGYWTCLDYLRKDGTPLNINLNNLSYKSTPVSITAWSYSGTTTTTITLTVASHTFIVGDWINVNGLTTSTAVSTANNYIIPNGIYQVTAFTGTTIQYQIITPSALTLTPTVSSATVIGQTAVNGVVGGLGFGQTWQDMTTSRATQTTYTNSTGKPITAFVSKNNATNGSWYFYINGVSIGAINGYGTWNSAMVIIPNGATYMADNFAGLVKWMELR